MAYDRDDARGSRERWRSDERFDRERDPRRGENRGFLERAGDEIASWFGDDGQERRHGQDNRLRGGEEDYGRDYRRETSRERGSFDRPQRDRFSDGERAYRPMAGDYGRSERDFGRSNWDRDEYRRTSFAGSERPGLHDPHYAEWRRRQLEELDRDYDEYRREHQSRFESEFSDWRNRRQSKRQMLGQVREHMDVTGSDGEPVGKVDRVAGDRIILTKSDPEAGGAHHSLPCTALDRVEGDRLILDCTAEQAKQRWRDESRDRALFEREDQGEAGPMSLERSFSGTYR